MGGDVADGTPVGQGGCDVRVYGPQVHYRHGRRLLQRRDRQQRARNACGPLGMPVTRLIRHHQARLMQV